MEKRLVTAVLISIVFIAILQWAAPKLFPELARPKPAVTSTSAEKPASSQPAAGTSGVPPAATTSGAPAVTTSSVAPEPAPVAAAMTSAPPPTPMVPVGASSLQVVTVDTSDYTARFSNRGAELVSFLLKHYKNHDGTAVELVKAREPQRTDFPFAFISADPSLAPRLNSALYAVDDSRDGGVRIITFRYASGGVSATKTFRFTDEYLFSFSAQVTPGRNVRIEVGPGIRTLEKEEGDSRFVITGNGLVQIGDSLKTINREKAKFAVYDDPQFVGVEDNYFLSALKPEHDGAAGFRGVDFPHAAT